jgi:protein ImuB
MNPPAGRFASAWIPGFAAAALARRDPDLRDRPVAALETAGGTQSVCAVTPAARAGGIRPGMSAREARLRVPDLVGRVRDHAAEGSAAAALRDAAWALSPRVEVVAPEEVHLDLAGLASLAGPEARLGQRLVDAIAALGLPAHVGIADTRTTAALAARQAPGLTIVPPGGDAGFLAPVPISLLEPAPELAESLERWGIRTLGELAVLPRGALSNRLGPAGMALQSRARGVDLRPLVPSTPATRWIEALTLDWEVASLEALGFVLQRLLGRLCARLAVRDLGATALTLTLDLARGHLTPDGPARGTGARDGRHTRRVGLVAPLREPRAMLARLLAALEPVSLPAPVVALGLEAETAPFGALQTELFAPPRPSPRELGETLGRLAALVGSEAVGVPVLADTHRPGAFDVAPFPGAGGPPDPSAPAAERPPMHVTGAALVCRRLSPPLPAKVTLAGGRPVHVAAAGLAGRVVARAGPWRSAGEWWTGTAWTREEWDVQLPDGAVYRLACDRATGTWALDAVYD